MQLARRHDELGPQTAVAVNPERLMLFAAVGVAALAGVTRLAVDVRLDGAMIAGLNVGDRSADLEHLDAEFVSRDARIAGERHLAEVAADVGAADADAMDAHKRFGCR